MFRKAVLGGHPRDSPKYIEDTRTTGFFALAHPFSQSILPFAPWLRKLLVVSVVVSKLLDAFVFLCEEKKGESPRPRRRCHAQPAKPCCCAEFDFHASQQRLRHYRVFRDRPAERRPSPNSKSRTVYVDRTGKEKAIMIRSYWPDEYLRKSHTAEDAIRPDQVGPAGLHRDFVRRTPAAWSRNSPINPPASPTLKSSVCSPSKPRPSP